MDAIAGVASSTIERNDIGRARGRPTDDVAGAGNDHAVNRIPHRHRSGNISANDIALDEIVVRHV